MADETSTERQSVIGFSGTLARASESVEPFFKDQQGQEFKSIAIHEEQGQIHYALGRKTVQNSRQVLIEAVVSDSPDGQGVLVTFRHPLKRESLVGIAVAPDDVRPEVDGVWVADEGGGDY